jgi:hypothetical protein
LKFTPKLLLQVAGSQSDPRVERRSLFQPDYADAISIPNPYLPFAGDYSRADVDLISSKDGHALVVPDPFKGEKCSTPASPDRAHLTGHAEFAQLGGSASVVIGFVRGPL